MSKANSELKAITRDYNKAFRFLSEQEYNEKLLSLKPGENAPIKGKLTGGRREKMEEKAIECRRKAADIINRELTAVNKKITAAPSTEAVNTIALLNMRDPKTISPEMICTLLDEYGDNVQSYETIRDIAKQKGFNIDFAGVDHPLRETQASIEALSRSLNKSLTLSYTEQEGRSSEGYEAFLEMTIDNTFDPE